MYVKIRPGPYRQSPNGEIAWVKPSLAPLNP